jgi:exodeoxyribonuclease VII large subunit
MANNSYKFGFSLSLFPALVQGEGAEKSMIKALEKVYELEDAFDLVVLIRGGGSQADLDCFNGFDLALNIAQFPIPVITGIGHERDETISDMVAHKSLKTPTAVAEFIINKLLEFSNKLDRYQDNFEQMVRWIIQQQSLILQQKASDLNFLVQQFISEERYKIKEYLNQTGKSSREIIHISENNLNNNLSRLKYLWKTVSEHGKRDLNSYKETLARTSKYLLHSSSDKLNGFKKNLQLVSPENVLSRGYSISYINGEVYFNDYKDIRW